MPDYWGYHLLIDIKECTPESIRSEDNFKAFLKTLIERIDMIAYGEPILKHFATHDPLKAGYSIVQLIETSNITGHFVDLNGDGYIDVFSCKPFDAQDVLDVIQEYFSPRSMKHQSITRSA
jgi:S-adenosylmethionine/arginine decarboxylase-like enzyme